MARPRGSVRKRGPSWAIVIDLGYLPDSEGRLKRKQKFLSFRGTHDQAQKKLTEMLRSVDRGEFVEPSKITVTEWIGEWIERAIKPPLRAASTYDSYRHILSRYVSPAIGSIRLQHLRALHLDQYYANVGTTLNQATVQVHHALISSALKAAVSAGLVSRNEAALVAKKPKKATSPDVLAHVWNAQEAKVFLIAAKAAGPQLAALFALALDSGARRGELASVKWSDLDLDTGRVTIQRHLVRGGDDPIFGLTKNKQARTIELAVETLALLKAHKSHQAEIKIKNRKIYHDHGLIFAKEWGDLHQRQESLGHPLQVNNIGAREFARVIKAANVRRIKFHGLRHTCATLMLSAGVPANTVQRRLGHTKVQMTLDVYGHVLPSMQQDAADRLAALLHG